MRIANAEEIAKAIYLLPREVVAALAPLPSDAGTLQIQAALVEAVRSVLWAREKARRNYQPRGDTPMAQALLLAERAALAQVHGINWAVLRSG